MLRASETKYDLLCNNTDMLVSKIKNSSTDQQLVSPFCQCNKNKKLAADA